MMIRAYVHIPTGCVGLMDTDGDGSLGDITLIIDSDASLLFPPKVLKVDTWREITPLDDAIEAG